jgi:hypothetical protein
MRPVREEDVGGKAPDPLPWNFLALLTKCLELLYFLTVRLLSRVAGKA